MSTPSFGLNPLDAERKRLERRRALVDILQKQALAGPEMPNVPGAQMSPYQGLAKMGEALIAALANRAQEKREKEFAGKELAQKQQEATGIAQMLMPKGPNLGPAVTPTKGPVGGYAPIYAPEQQVAAPGGEMVSMGPALSRDISEQLSMPGQQNLSGTFAAQQQNQIGINAQNDARRNLLAQTIAAGGDAANLAITQQVAANERAYAEQERKRREAVEANIRAEQAAEERSRFAAETSQRASETASSRALTEAKLNEDRRQFEETNLRQAQQFKATQQQALQTQIARSAEENRQRKYDAEQRKLDREAALARTLISSGNKDAYSKAPASVQSSALNSANNVNMISKAIRLLQDEKNKGLSLENILTPQRFKTDQNAVNLQSILGRINAMQIVDVAGRAQNANEMKNIKMFIPNMSSSWFGAQSDTTESAVTKLKNLLNHEQQNLDSISGTYGFAPKISASTTLPTLEQVNAEMNRRKKEKGSKDGKQSN